MAGLKDKIKSNGTLKALAMFLLMPRNQYRPRWWVRHLWNPLVHKRGRGSHISRRARMDVMPFNDFSMGEKSLIEDFSVVNNQVGEVHIGDRTLIGISSVVIGPVTLGNDILIAQHVVMSGLNHGYEDPNLSIREHKVTTSEIVIEDQAWLGANVVITAGRRIGKHSIVAAGSIVTKDVPPYSIVVGNPARVIKQYNFDTKQWEKVTRVKEIN